MIYVIATIMVRPGTEDDFLRHARPFIAASRAEAGCIAYDMHVSAVDPGKIVSVEQWKTRDAIRAHNTSAHLQTLVGAVGPLLTAPPQLAMIVPQTVETLSL